MTLPKNAARARYLDRNAAMASAVVARQIVTGALPANATSLRMTGSNIPASRMTPK